MGYFQKIRGSRTVLLVGSRKVGRQQNGAFLQRQPCDKGILVCILAGTHLSVFRP